MEYETKLVLKRSCEAVLFLFFDELLPCVKMM